MKKNVFFIKGTKETASEFAANIFSSLFWYNSDIGRNMLFGTATGKTPVLTYQKFAELHVNRADGKTKEVAKYLRFMQLDNYISPGSTAENLPNYSYETELRNGIWKVPNNGCFIPKEYAENPEEEAERYKAIIQEQLAWKTCYIQLLGIGDTDGHIAFNMPGTTFDSSVHVVELNQETITANAQKFFDGDESLVPKKAITMGIGDILKADIIVLEAFGKKKSDIIYKSFFEKATEQVPASALQNYKGLLFVVLDDDAAEKIADFLFEPIEEFDISETINNFFKE